LAIDETG